MEFFKNENHKIKVLVIDDSAIVRDLLGSYIASQNDMELVATAPDPYVGRDKIVQLKPDVITLDIEMPRMDGLTFLDKLMHYWPIPVIIVSSITQKDNTTAIKALELGAFDVVNKPSGSISVNEVKEDIINKIRLAYESKEQFLKKWKKLSESYTEDENRLLREKKELLNKKFNIAKSSGYLNQVKTTDRLVAIGSSTGGTVALEYIFQRLPRVIPPILVVQHMPPTFTYQFARRLNELCEPNVKEAEDGELIQKGTIYIAPGGYHMELVRSGEIIK
ncbi:MAG: chemotaxis protein CheB, partial [Exilispira sp.]